MVTLWAESIAPAAATRGRQAAEDEDLAWLDPILKEAHLRDPLAVAKPMATPAALP